MMLAIREMHDLIKRLMSKRNPLYRNLVDKESIIGKLLHGILSNRYTNDQEAALGLYGDVHEETRRIESYRTTKYQLVNSLINALFFLTICHKTYSKYLVNAYTAKKEIVAAELLMWFGCHSAMRLLTGRVLKKAKKFHLTRETLRCYEMLRHHATIHGTQRECLEYTAKVEEVFKILGDEIWASNAKAKIRAELVEKLSLSPQSLESLLEMATTLEQKAEKHQTRTLWQNCGIGAGLVYRHAGQYNRALSLYDRQLEFFQKNRHLSSVVRESQIYFYALRCCLVMRDYDKAKCLAVKSLKIEESGTSNWFALLSLHCLLAFHTRNWNDASKVFKWVVNHPQFKKENHRIEIWSIFEGYLRIFIDEDKKLPKDVTVHGAEFQLHQLLEEIDVVRKDKSGLNISVLIFQVLLRLKYRQFDLLESRIDSLRNYLYNHLRQDADGRFLRTETLFCMLITMVNCEYKIKITHEKTQVLAEQLRELNLPDHCFGQQIEEIVPYEHIWERVLQELEQIETEGLFVKEYRGPAERAQQRTVKQQDSSVKTQSVN